MPSACGRHLQLSRDELGQRRQEVLSRLLSWNRAPFTFSSGKSVSMMLWMRAGVHVRQLEVAEQSSDCAVRQSGLGVHDAMSTPSVQSGLKTVVLTQLMDRLHLPDVGHGVGLEQHVPLGVDLLVHQLRNVPHALAILG